MKSLSLFFQIFLALFIASPSIINAQSAEERIWLDHHGDAVPDSIYASTYRVVKHVADSLYEINDHYLSGQLKMEAKVLVLKDTPDWSAFTKVFSDSAQKLDIWATGEIREYSAQGLLMDIRLQRPKPDIYGWKVTAKKYNEMEYASMIAPSFAKKRFVVTNRIVSRNQVKEGNTYTLSGSEGLSRHKMALGIDHYVILPKNKQTYTDSVYAVGSSKQLYLSKLIEYNNSEKAQLTVYHENGQKKQVSKFLLANDENYPKSIKPILYDTIYIWHENGNLAYKEYRELKIDSVKSRKKQGIYSLLTNHDNLVGTQYYYHTNGQLNVKREMAEGQASDIRYWQWFDNGQLSIEYKKVKGSEDNFIRTYHKNGQINCHINLNPELAYHDSVTIFLPSGRISGWLIYKNGVLIDSGGGFYESEARAFRYTKQAKQFKPNAFVNIPIFEWASWREDGSMIETGECTVLNGEQKKDGVWKYFDEAGKIYKKETYDKFKLKETKYYNLSKHPCSVKAVVTFWQSDESESYCLDNLGEQLFYRDSVTANADTIKVLYKRIQIMNKDRDMKYELFHPNGQTALQGFLSCDLFSLDEKRPFEYTAGVLSTISFAKSALWREWSQEGTLMASSEYGREANLLSSPTNKKHYFPNGNIRFQEKMLEDEETVECSLYSPSGQLLMRYYTATHYLDGFQGKKNGPQYFYSPSGKLVEKRLYKNGWRVE